MSALQPRAREFEEHQPAYTFCVRTTATYECPFYAADGTLRRVRRRVTAHGTAFAYRQQDGGTLLLTNDHVAEWPVATDDDHPVDGVPAGCRRVSDALRLVDGEDDQYEPDDVPLTRVVADPQLDVAVLKARAPLPVMPWKIGRSAALRARDVVNVRGFPLGIIKADNVGKVVSAFDHDDFKEWDHDDFVVDALLSGGNSGSPVFAVSCRTGELELVGVYHAAYSQGSALNVVIGIDQVRDLMTTLRRAPRARTDGVALDAAGRAVLAAAAAAPLDASFPFGALVASLRSRPDGTLLFVVYSPEYPVDAAPLLVVEDARATAPDAFGPLGRVWVGGRQGLKPYARGDLDADAQGQLSRVLDALRRDAIAAFRYRAAAASADGSKDRFEQAERLQKALRRSIAAHRDQSQSVADLADRLGPARGEHVVTLAEALGPPPGSTPSVVVTDVVAAPPAAAPPRAGAPPGPGTSARGSAAP
jgi:serine protease Do